MQEPVPGIIPQAFRQENPCHSICWTFFHGGLTTLQVVISTSKWMSASTAVKWVQRKRETGSVEAKPMHGHPPAKLLSHKHRLLRLVADEPDLTLRQICERLAADGIHVSKSCLHTFLWRNRIRLKKDRARGGAESSGREEAA